MNTSNIIAKNTVLMLFSNILGRIFAFIYIMLTARYLGAADFGILSFSIAFAQIFGIFSDFGLDPIMIREVARDKSSAYKYFTNVFLLKTLLCLITSLLIFVTVKFLKYSSPTNIIIYIITLSVFLRSFSKIYDSIFQAHERMLFSSSGFILTHFFILLGVITVISNNLNISFFAVTFVIAHMLVLFYNIVILRSFFFTKKSLPHHDIMDYDPSFLKQIFTKATPFFLSAFVTIAAFRIDTIMLSFMKGNQAVGFYSASFKIVELFLFIPMGIGTVVYPRLSRYFIDSNENFKKIYKKLFKYLIAIAIPIAVTISLLADKLIILIFKETFYPSILSLKILIWVIPIIFLTSTYGVILASINKQKVALKINLSCLFLNIFSNLILIPKHGINGAAIATLLTTGLSLLLCFYYVSQNFYKLPILENKVLLLKLLAANVFLAIFIKTSYTFNIIFILLSSCLFYSTLILLLKFIIKEDLLLLSGRTESKILGKPTKTFFSIINFIKIIFSKASHNFFIENWLECKKNKVYLKKARLKEKYSGNIKQNPLVSVRIATYNRADLLTKRTIPSILNQTYQNFEIIVVGDNCTDNTEELIAKFHDKRIRFYNLSQRGNYPKQPMRRWMVAGVTPMNKAVAMASGDWIAPLDDDDTFTDDHIEKLLNFALASQYEMVYGKVLMQISDNEWKSLGSWPPRLGKICHLSVLYSANLKFMQYDINAWKYYEPADWNLWRRMKEAGVKIGFLDAIVGKHFLEGTQRKEHT